MKKYQIVFSSLAKRDLGSIFSYVEDVSSVENAKLVISRIAQRINKYCYFPERTEPFIYTKEKIALYSTISGKYRIVFLIDKTNAKVVVARVFSISQRVSAHHLDA